MSEQSNERVSHLDPVTVPETGELKKNSVGFFATLGGSMGIQAPTAGIALIPAVMAGYVGRSGPLAFTIGVVVGLFIASSFAFFGRKFASAGSSYLFNGIALGRSVGFVSAWLLGVTYITFTGSVAAEGADYIQALGHGFQSVPWFVYAVVIALLAGWFALRSLEVSSGLSATLEVLGVGFVVIVGLVIMGKGGYAGQGLTGSPFTTGGLSFSAFAFGVVYAFSGFAGFEGAATFGEESAEPRKTIPRAIFTAILGVGIAYIFGDYIVTIGFPSAQALASSSAPLVYVSDHFVGNWAGTLIDVLAILSAVGCVIASINAGSRVLYQLGRDGALPPLLGKTHGRAHAPQWAVGATVALGIVALLPLAGGSPADAFGLVVTVGAICVLFVYFLTTVGAAWYSFRTKAHVARVVLLAIGIPLSGYVVYDTVWPVPTYPYNIVAYSAYGLLIVGILAAAFVKPVKEAIAKSEIFS